MFTKKTNSNLPAIAFAVAALASVHPAAALADTGPKTERVAYGDLNLASPEGIKVLDRRLDRAVKRVCDSGIVYDLQTKIRSDECERQTHLAIKGQRNYAIAQATGQNSGQRWADNASHNSPVTLSE